MKVLRTVRAFFAFFAKWKFSENVLVKCCWYWLSLLLFYKSGMFFERLRYRIFYFFPLWNLSSAIQTLVNFWGRRKNRSFFFIKSFYFSSFCSWHLKWSSRVNRLRNEFILSEELFTRFDINLISNPVYMAWFYLISFFSFASIFC